MAVRVVAGRAGSGKTDRCFRAIVEALQNDPLGPPVFWIVPKQSTFSVERALTCTSGLSAFCRARVLSFEGLGEEILLDCGGAALPQVTAVGRQMVIGHLLREHQPQLKHYTSVAHHIGLAAEIDTTFSEIERRGKSAEDLAQLLRELDEAAQRRDIESAALAAKVHDLHLIYAAYRTYLGTDRLDPHGRLNHVLSCIERCKILRGAAVYVDGFLEFSDYERRTLVALAKSCALLEITLLCDPKSPTLANPHTLPDEMSLYHRTEQTYRALWFAMNEADVEIEEPIRLDKVCRFRSPSLTQVERYFDGAAKTSDSAKSIELIEAPDRRAEVDAVARRIRALLRDDGFRLRDIGVLARDANDYVDLIDASFREHDIAYFADRRRTAAHHPLLQFVRSALMVARHVYPHDPMMLLLKTGLAGAELEDADELENYVLRHRVRGKAWASDEPWTLRRNADLAAALEIEGELPPAVVELNRVNAIRDRVIGPLRPFVAKLRASKRYTVREIVAAIFELFDAYKLRHALGRWMSDAVAAERHEERGEHEQVWSELTTLFDQMVDLLGEQSVTLANFQEILDSGLEQFDLALTPPTVDQVLVGQVERTRTSEFRVCFVLGMNETQFPKLSREDTVFSDSERRSLTKRKIDLDPDTTRKLLDERLFGYIAFTRASERLILTRSISDSANRSAAPSPFWHRVRELFPTIEPTQIPRESTDSPHHVGTPRQLVTALLKWANDSKTIDSRDGWSAIYQWLTSYPSNDDAIDRMRFRAWKAMSYLNDAALSPEIAKRMFPSPLSANVAQIESFASCPFQHFLRYGLRLREREGQDVTHADLGNIYHQVLDRIVRELLKSHRDWTKLDAAQAERLIADHVQDVGQSLRGQIMMSSARNRYLLDRIERTLAQVIASQKAMAERGHFRPAHTNVTFGADEGATLSAFRVRAGAGEIHLHGKIDRVDLVESASEMAVIDYRSGGGTLALDRVYYGISLQLLTYLLVLQANGVELHGKTPTPAAAFYLQLLRRLQNVQHPDEACEPDDPEFDLGVKPRGIFDTRVIRHLDDELTEGHKSKVIETRINKGGSFGKHGDHADSAAFAGLLKHVEAQLTGLGKRILDGEISLAPYYLHHNTPCPQCNFQSVCRFDRAINTYHKIESMKRDEVFDRVKEGRRA